MKNVPLVSANLATIFLESFLYGIFFVLSSTSLFLLVRRHRQQLSNPHLATRVPAQSVWRQPMFVAAVILSTTVTAHWIMTVIRAFDAFINFEGGTQPLLFYGNLSDITEVVKTGFLMTSLVVGDAMIIYRLWIIWRYNFFVIVFPLATLGGLTACGVGITYQFTQYFPGENVFVSAAGRWITSDCVFTLCTNVYSTVMIAYRVWKANKAIRRFGGSSLMEVLAIFVESAALYTSWTIFFFASYQSQSNLQFTAVDCWPAMSGIAFMLINVRVGLGWAQRAQDPSTVHSGIGPRTGGGGHGEHSYSMRPLAVNITRVVDQEDDFSPHQKKMGPGVSGEADSV